MNALSDRTFHPKFASAFDEFCRKYDKAEKEFKTGISDHRVWGKCLHSLAVELTNTSRLM